VSIHVKKDVAANMQGTAPTFSHPHFDFETRIVEARVGNTSFVSVYVPNGGKDYPAKLRFFESLVEWAKVAVESGRDLVLCGDLNIAHRDVDVHPTQRNEKSVGQRAEERRLFDDLLGVGLVDVVRALAPEDDRLFSWWPYWRQAREKNIGWRIDYVLASEALAKRATRCVVEREYGSSDHAPVFAEIPAVA
jgi:exodeoxyribonuclease-3